MGAKHTLVACSGLPFLLSRAVKWGGRHWPSCRGGGGGREPGETTSRQVTAGKASTWDTHTVTLKATIKTENMRTGWIWWSQAVSPYAGGSRAGFCC